MQTVAINHTPSSLAVQGAGRHHRRVLVAMIVSTLMAIGLLVAVPLSPADASSSDLYTRLNQARRAQGLPNLARNSKLDAVAQKWTQQMIKSNKLAHNPSYSKQIPSGWRLAGENVGYAGSSSRLHTAWMESPGHKANILNKRFNSVGIGFAKDSKGRVWGTQVFAQYSGVKAPKTVKPKVKSAVSGDPTGSFPRDWQNNNRPDVMATTSSGSLLLYPGTGTGSFGGKSQIGHGWKSLDLLTLTGDWDGDGNADLIARKPSNGALLLYPGNGKGRFKSPRQIGRGWKGFDKILSPADWDGDGNVDLLARRTNGALMLYPGNGKGGFKSGRQVGNGWQAMNLVSVAGDWNGDNKPDLVAADKNGKLYLYPGTGNGRFGSKKQIGTGWNIVDTLISVGDWDGDREPDLLAVLKDGKMRMYKGNGRGGFAGTRNIGHGWQSLELAR